MRPSDQVTIANKKITRRVKAGAEPDPRQEPTKDESRVGFDVQWNNPAKKEYQNQQLSQGREKGPQNPEHGSFVSEHEIPPHEVPYQIHMVFIASSVSSQCEVLYLLGDRTQLQLFPLSCQRFLRTALRSTQFMA